MQGDVGAEVFVVDLNNRARIPGPGVSTVARVGGEDYPIPLLKLWCVAHALYVPQIEIIDQEIPAIRSRMDISVSSAVPNAKPQLPMLKVAAPTPLSVTRKP